ncbi:MAG: lipopolysaccharide biosynthesis protein [Micavibrio sp.]|nr:lipopolysaccharide biosynthesis protein [Micavibrio sp.]
MSLRQFTIGSASMASVSILRMLTQLFIIPALARFLTATDYGIVAIAMPFVLFGMMFADAGISGSLIRTSSRNVAEWSTSFWLTIMLGSGLSLALVGVGYLISLFLNEPPLFPIIAALSSIVFFQAIATVPGASLQQHNKFTIIAGVEITSMFLSLAGTYVAATHGWGAWSLVVQQIIQFATRFILTLIFSPFRPHAVFQISAIRDHLLFGRNMLGNSFVTFMRQSLTNTIIGKQLGTAPVGIFTMGALFSDLPNRVVSGPIQQVIYPRMAQMRDDPAAIRLLFLFLTRLIAILIFPAVGMLAVAHKPVFTLLLSEKWQQSGLIFMILAPAAAVQTVIAMKGTIAMALGRTDIMMRQSWELSILALVLLFCAVSFGIEAVAVAATLAAVLYAPRALLQITRLINLPVRDFIGVITVPAITTIAGITLYAIITAILPLTNWEAFAVAFFIGLTALMAAFFVQFWSIRQEMEIVKYSLEHGTPPPAPSPAQMAEA